MHKVGLRPATPTETDGLCVQVRAVLTRQGRRDFWQGI